MIEKPNCKLDYLLLYFDILSRIDHEDSENKWNLDELRRVSQEITEEINNLDA